MSHVTACLNLLESQTVSLHAMANGLSVTPRMLVGCLSERANLLYCRYCKEAENSVMEFKAAVHKAEAKCRLISETMLLKVERKRMYEHREFAAQQAEHHTKVSCALVSKLEHLNHVVCCVVDVCISHTSCTFLACHMLLVLHETLFSPEHILLCQSIGRC